MSDAPPEAAAKTPWHLWLIGAALTLWNSVGAFDFTASMTRFAPYMASFPQEWQDYWATLPIWIVAIWGIAVWGGVGGSILLLLRSKTAPIALAASLVCAIAFTIWGLINPGPPGSSDPLFAGVIILIAALSFAYALWMQRRGVLR